MWRAKVRIFQAEGISMQRLWDGATLSVCDEHQKDEFGLSGVSEKEMITSMYETTEWISCVYVVASGLNIIALCYLFIKHTCMFSHSIMPQFFVTPWTIACQAPLSIEFFQARILEWVAISYSRGSSRPRDQTHVSCVSCTGREILYHWTTWEALSIHSTL